MNTSNNWRFKENGTASPDIVLTCGANTVDDSVQILIQQLESGVFGNVFIKGIETQGDVITELILGTSESNIDAVTERRVALMNDFPDLGLTKSAKQEDLNKAIVELIKNVSLSAGAGLYENSITPTSTVPDVESKVFTVTIPGTYTNFGGVNLPANHWGFIFKNGNNFSIQSVEIEMQDLTVIESDIKKSIKKYDVNDSPYNINSIVLFEEKFYQSLKDNNTDLPTNSISWKSVTQDIKLNEEGGVLGFDKFEEMTSGSPSVVVKEYNSDTFNIIGAIDNSGVFHSEWNGGLVTDFIPVSAGHMVEVTALSNSMVEVPLFVVYKTDKTSVLFKQSASTTSPQTISYVAVSDCFIRVNCALKASVSLCKIKIYNGVTNATKIVSDANILDYHNTEIGFVSWKAGNSALGLKRKRLNEVAFKINEAPFVSKKRLLNTNTIVDDTLTTTKLLHNYSLNGKKFLYLKGRMYDDRNQYWGVIGIKENGDLVEVLGVQGGVTEPFIFIDLIIDVSMYTKISMCVDTSVYSFEGSLFDSLSDEYYSEEIEDLKKNNSKEKTMKQRIINGDKPSEVLGLTSQRNEANIFKFKEETFFLWSEGWDQSIIKVGNYDVLNNSVTNITTAIDATKSGISAPIFKCPTTFVLNQKVYLIMTVWSPNYCILYESEDGRNFTEVSRTLANVAGFTTYGNHWIVTEKINGYYYWFIEGLVNNVWKMNLLKSQQINTGWELVGEVKGLTSGSGAKGGPCVYYHNGKFKMIYHYGPGSTNLPTYIAYAEADVHDPLYFKPFYYPLMAIEHKPWGNLTDQYADPELCEIDGKTYLFCSVVDNTTPRATIYRWECDGRLSSILDSRI